MDLYQQFIAKSRYARFLDKEHRRENWKETVARYFDFMQNHLKENKGYVLSAEERKELEDAVYNLEVMPSMRALMTAGKALERDNTAGYNCAYITVDDAKAFDEAMFILLCGTGVGFSVERQYIAKLPEVPEKIYDSETVIAVSDSKEGWAKSLRQLIALLYSGEAPKWDMKKVRPAGARLKVFGGRASGPGPLEDLFKFVIMKFKGAQGRKLTSLECHDIMCKIGEVVVVGGVRRSAMISLSNLSDERMRNAKAGAWWEANPQRALANNSACYTEKPDVGTFMEEFLALYNSKSGERGIFSREASKKIVELSGRRDSNHDFGTNPCSEIILRPNQFCNLTEAVLRDDDTEESIKRKLTIAVKLGTIQATLTQFPYLRKIWQRNTEEESLLGVSLTGIFDNKLTANPRPEFLVRLKEHCVEVNQDFAQKIGVNPAAAITCVKPSGTVSQLTNTASGIHPRHAPYYIRRVRGDVKDPLTDFMIKNNVPCEPCYLNPSQTVVFSFPQKSADGAFCNKDLSALEHLEVWLAYQKYWCEHKPSVTISVEEHEWPGVAAFVWDNFDWMSGVSFLPKDGGSYKQAPYEEINKEQYEAAKATMPTSLNWDMLIEHDDNVEGVQTLACTGGACEI